MGAGIAFKNHLRFPCLRAKRLRNQMIINGVSVIQLHLVSWACVSNEFQLRSCGRSDSDAGNGTLLQIIGFTHLTALYEEMVCADVLVTLKSLQNLFFSQLLWCGWWEWPIHLQGRRQVSVCRNTPNPAGKREPRGGPAGVLWRRFSSFMTVSLLWPTITTTSQQDWFDDMSK